MTAASPEPTAATSGATAAPKPPRRGLARRAAAWLYPRKRLQVGLLLAGPVGWLAIAYFGSLFVLLLNAFWAKDAFTGNVEPFDWSLKAFQDLANNEVYRFIAVRTVVMAALVTLADAIVAFPIAYYMARIAKPRTRNLMVVAILMPLWASYLVKVYAWRTILQGNGFLEWLLGPSGSRVPASMRSPTRGSSSATYGCRT